MGQDKYPQDIEEAYNRMLSYSPILGATNTSDKTTKDLNMRRITFYQTNNYNSENCKLVPGVVRKIFKDVK